MRDSLAINLVCYVKQKSEIEEKNLKKEKKHLNLRKTMKKYRLGFKNNIGTRVESVCYGQAD